MALQSKRVTSFKLFNRFSWRWCCTLFFPPCLWANKTHFVLLLCARRWKMLVSVHGNRFLYRIHHYTHTYTQTHKHIIKPNDGRCIMCSVSKLPYSVHTIHYTVQITHTNTRKHWREKTNRRKTLATKWNAKEYSLNVQGVYCARCAIFWHNGCQNVCCNLIFHLLRAAEAAATTLYTNH